MDREPVAFDHKAFLKTLTTRPGVYRMLDHDGTILYVGKAGDLKKRVTSYFRKSGLSVKTRLLVEQIVDIEVTVTRTEAEALLLESNLIKQHRPRYKVHGAGRAAILVPIRVHCRCATACTCYKNSSGCASVRTAFLQTAVAPACSTRSSAVRRPVLA
jgi:predicted GIY-YIG superfamily endonuclease